MLRKQNVIFYFHFIKRIAHARLKVCIFVCKYLLYRLSEFVIFYKKLN